MQKARKQRQYAGNPTVWKKFAALAPWLLTASRVKLATALVDKLEQPIRLAPMSTFPVIRDLVIDRERMFNALKRVKAWIPIDGTYDLGPGPRMAESKRQWAYELSKCMTCGVCLEACPNVNDARALSDRLRFPKFACSMFIQQVK